jgi:hypothetical protein
MGHLAQLHEAAGNQYCVTAWTLPTYYIAAHKHQDVSICAGGRCRRVLGAHKEESSGSSSTSGSMGQADARNVLLMQLDPLIGFLRASCA